MLKKYLKTLFRHFFIWTLAFAFWTTMREFGQEIATGFEPLSFVQHLSVHLILGLCAGLLFGSFEFLYEKYIFRSIGFGKAVVLGSLGYAVVVGIIIVLALMFYWLIQEDKIGLDQFLDVVLTKQLFLVVFYFLLVGTLINLFREIDKKFGQGNLWKMFKGEFYSPKEEEKIFMFLDLKSSTEIAETIGHIAYSKMLQDCFKDMAIVEKYGAEIYQYVGDEAVLTWNLKDGISDNKSIRTYYGFKRQLAGRRKHYQKRYGLFPEFKAGLHLGKIVTAEVGVHKREIAYHGDTINTASRIQEKCNLLDREFLVSEMAKDSFVPTKMFRFQDEGEIGLKGKTQKVRIFSVSRIY
ncbi:MAG: adenylate/guanylate cyclase domain-containing protein [Pricia sp.]